MQVTTYLALEINIFYIIPVVLFLGVLVYIVFLIIRKMRSKRHSLYNFNAQSAGANSKNYVTRIIRCINELQIYDLYKIADYLQLDLENVERILNTLMQRGHFSHLKLNVESKKLELILQKKSSKMPSSRTCVVCNTVYFVNDNTKKCVKCGGRLR